MTALPPVPYALVIIQPPTVGRGQAPFILSELLEKAPVVLAKFRAWRICGTTHAALLGIHKATLVPPSQRHSWVCLFTHKDRVTDPTPFLEQALGPEDKMQLLPSHIRFRVWTGDLRDDPIHSVARLSSADRVALEAKLLFLDFDDKDI